MSDETTGVTNLTNSQTNNGLTPSGATSIHGLTVLGDGLPKLQRPPVVAHVGLSADEMERRNSEIEARSLRAAHESAHAVCAAVCALPPTWPGGGWQGLQSVYGSRVNASHVTRIKSIDISTSTGGHTHVSRDMGRSFSTSQDVAANIVISLGGIAIERLFGTVSDGAEGDYRTSTRLCSQILSMNADRIAVGTDSEPGSMLPAMDSIGDRSTEMLRHEYITRLRLVLDDGMQEALRICRQYRAAIVALADIVAVKGRLSDGAVIEAMKSVGIPVMDTVRVDDHEE
jgi:hypothetical protein